MNKLTQPTQLTQRLNTETLPDLTQLVFETAVSNSNSI